MICVVDVEVVDSWMFLVLVGAHQHRDLARLEAITPLSTPMPQSVWDCRSQEQWGTIRSGVAVTVLQFTVLS